MAMQNPEIFITEDGERRQLVGDELELFLIQREKDQAEKAAQLLAKQEKDSAKAALLERLGITEEEVKLLLS